MTGKYILKGHTPVPCDDVIEWGIWFEATAKSHGRTVAVTTFGDVRVSTVFLGLDHSFGQGPPILFETLVFGGEFDQEMDRYSTWEEAEEGHREMCKRVGISNAPPDIALIGKPRKFQFEE